MAHSATAIRRPRPDLRDGIIETLLAFEGRAIELDRHLERLTASALTLYGERPPQLRALIAREAVDAGLGRMRVDLVPREGGGLEVDVALAPFEPQLVLPIDEVTSELRTFAVDRGYGEHKWADREFLGQLEAAAGAGAVPLLVKEGGEVLEASRANLFVVRGRRIITPPPEAGILPGIARAAVIELSGDLGVPVEEARFEAGTLRGADEVFLTGSLRGIEPVRAIDGQPLHGVGPLTRELATALRERWFGGWL